MSTATIITLRTAIVAALTGTTSAGARIDVGRVLPYTEGELADGPRIAVTDAGEESTHAGGGRARYSCRGSVLVQAVLTAADEAALVAARDVLLQEIEGQLLGPDAPLLALIDRVDRVQVATEAGTMADGATLVSESRMTLTPVYTDTYPATVAGTTLAGVDLDYDLVDEGESVDIEQTVEAE